MALLVLLALLKNTATDTSKLRAAAAMLMGDIDFARSESLAHPDDLRMLVINSGGNSYLLAASSNSSSAITNPVDGARCMTTFGVGRAAPLGTVTISNYTFSGTSNQLKFGPFGQLSGLSSSASITLSSGTCSMTLAINPDHGGCAVVSGP
jgi:hypothetical protein